MQAIRPATTSGYRYAVDYLQLDPANYSTVVGTGTIEAKIVILAAGTMGTPVILQRSAALLGAMPAAVGRHFSPNGDRVTLGGHGRGQGREPARPRTRTRRRLRGLRHRQADRHHDLRLPRPERARVLALSLQQIYFPPLTNILAEDGTGGPPSWFGIDKRDLTARWRSWLTIAGDDGGRQRGRLRPAARDRQLHAPRSGRGLGQLSYHVAPETRLGFDASDAEVKAIVERDGLGTHPSRGSTAATSSAPPAGVCRIGDDPATSALDDRHELRGHPGIFVTDASAVPTSLCVNPSLTIAALAERAAELLLARAATYGVTVAPRISPPGKTASQRLRRCIHPA